MALAGDKSVGRAQLTPCRWPDAGHQFGAINEWIPIALKLFDPVVAAALPVVDGILFMPSQKSRFHPVKRRVVIAVE